MPEKDTKIQRKKPTKAEEQKREREAEDKRSKKEKAGWVSGKSSSARGIQL